MGTCIANGTEINTRYTVSDYLTGDTLAGRPTNELIDASLAAAPTGAVRAHLRDGVWHLADQADGTARTVYVD